MRICLIINYYDENTKQTCALALSDNNDKKAILKYTFVIQSHVNFSE